MSAMPSFLYKDKDALVFKPENKEMVVYVPEKYFERNIAEQVGEYINLLGVFDYTIQDLKTGQAIGLKSFRFPTMFSTKPYVTEKVKQLKLIETSQPANYRIMRYRAGDEVVVSTKVVQFIGNVEKFNNLFFILGHIINTIPYDKIHEYVIDAMSLNGNSYGLNAQMFGFVISEICRSIKDPSIPYRLSGSNDLHAYQSMSVKTISKFISPYTALISEDFDESILYAMMNESPKETPLEQILVGN